MSGTFIIVPAFNEQGNIEQMVARCRPYGRVVVVDDGSTDITGPLALLEGAQLVTNPPGSQHGDGIRAGLRYALDHGGERIVTMDAGASYNCADIPRLLEALRCCDLAIGSRVLDGSWREQPWGRRLLTTVGTRLLGALTGGWRHPLDYTSFRAYTPAAARRVLEIAPTLDQRCHVFNPSLIFSLWREGFSIAQVPVGYTATNSTLNLSAALGALWSLLCLWQATRWEKETKQAC